MKTKKLWSLLLITILAFTLFIMGCGADKDDDDKKKKDDETEIELSDSKVTIEVGDEYDVTVDNYDDLKKVSVEIEDEDIAEADIDDDVITVVGISEGKTKLIVSAKGCEDVEITVKVEASEDDDDDDGDVLDPDDVLDDGGSSSSGGVAVGGDEDWAAGYYEAEFYLTDEFWGAALGMDGDVPELFSNSGLSLKFTMDLYDDGTGVLDADPDLFVSDFYNWLDENYIDFMKAVIESEGETWDSSVEQSLLSIKDEMMDAFEEEMSSEMTADEDYSSEISWTQDGYDLYITVDGEERVASLNRDGSFSIILTDEDLGADMMGDMDEIVLNFVRID